jgi:epoxyqueuosine reductase
MPELHSEEVKAMAEAAGLAVTALSPVRRLIERLDGTGWIPESPAGSRLVLPALEQAVADPLRGSILACAFPYACDAPRDPGVPDDVGEIAGFARRNYYRAAVKALQRVAREAGARLGRPQSEFRIFCNSRIPEKPLAYAAGLGRYGKNRLLFTEAYGSRFVIGLLFLPVVIEGEGAAPDLLSPAEYCGPCEACGAACPVSALAPGVDPGLAACLKTRSDSLEVWDEATRRAWGTRLYGCDTCQSVCPKNRVLPDTPAVTEGVIGPDIDLVSFLSQNEAECRARFKKTALDRTWILPEALLRNALCAAGNSRARRLREAVALLATDGRPLIRDMARWALERIEAKRAANLI